MTPSKEELTHQLDASEEYQKLLKSNEELQRKLDDMRKENKHFCFRMVAFKHTMEEIANAHGKDIENLTLKARLAMAEFELESMKYNEETRKTNQ